MQNQKVTEQNKAIIACLESVLKSALLDVGVDVGRARKGKLEDQLTDKDILYIQAQMTK
jgi:hypothetical protein